MESDSEETNETINSKYKIINESSSNIEVNDIPATHTGNNICFTNRSNNSLSKLMTKLILAIGRKLILFHFRPSSPSNS